MKDHRLSIDAFNYVLHRGSGSSRSALSTPCSSYTYLQTVTIRPLSLSSKEKGVDVIGNHARRRRFRRSSSSVSWRPTRSYCCNSWTTRRHRTRLHCRRRMRSSLSGVLSSGCIEGPSIIHESSLRTKKEGFYCLWLSSPHQGANFSLVFPSGSLLLLPLSVAPLPMVADAELQQRDCAQLLVSP